MQVRGSIQDPARDLGLYRPAGSTVGAVETSRAGPFGPEMYVNCSDPHDLQPAQHQLLVHQDASNASVGLHAGPSS